MSHRSVWLFGILSVLLLIISFSNAHSGESNRRNRPGYLIFLYDSQACQCVRERNEEFSEYIASKIREAVLDTTAISYYQYDYAIQSSIVDSLLSGTSERFLPVLMLKSYDNVLYYECSFMLDTMRFQQGLADFMMFHNKE